ncbi:P-loop containing nucleoside triphosphate hydrolase protein [Lentinula raphanica]|uniref:P-loop containing nucleoside triphosphate hydrolase protein n=1 Tax=Lentinula raphanica TaxID=153919 RepID=A0AA38U9W2_9AGAR|nr:P-loop containing nucleoside triphosphate hydrolase protein [Lentinula raphanica]
MNAQSQRLSSLPIPLSTLAALTKAGYDTLDDIPQSGSAKQLSDVLKLPSGISQTLYSSSQTLTSGGPSGFPSTQSAATLIGSSKHKPRLFTTYCPPLDTLLNGGLNEGGILELSGPPGSLKERILLNIVRSFVESGKRVLFIDCQNMFNPGMIYEHTKDIPAAHKLVSFHKILSLTELLMFMNNLSSFNNFFDLLAISCITFPFQNTQLTGSVRNNILEKIKQVITKLTISQTVTIVITSQLVTKLLNVDGTTGNFDTVGAKGVMVPPLGPSYLPSGKAFRVLVALNSPTLHDGVVRLLSPHKPGLVPEDIPIRLSFEHHHPLK